MRAVTKGGGHFQLNRRHTLHQRDLLRGAAPPADVAWDNFNGKPGTRQSCWHEQFGLCAFSEIVLDDNDLGMHLDHVEPKSVNPSRTFEHTNLVLCAISSDKLEGIPTQEVFGGHYRRNQYSATDFVNPLWANSRQFFHYASDGRVEAALHLAPMDKNKADYTISLLNLNSPILVNRRRRWLEELEEEIDGLLNHNHALAWFAECELCPTNGKLRPFHSAVRERFGAVGESVINQYCVHCA